MEFCRFLRSVKSVVRSLGRFLGRDVCLWLNVVTLRYFPVVTAESRWISTVA